MQDTIAKLIHYPEFIEAVRHYAAISPELGGRFYDELVRLFNESGAHPLRYRMFDPPLRRILAEDFPYAVLYEAKPDYAWILVVMHLEASPWLLARPSELTGKNQWQKPAKPQRVAYGPRGKPSPRTEPIRSAWFPAWW